MPERLPEKTPQAPLRLGSLLTEAYLWLMATVYLLFFDSRGLTAITAAKRNAYYALTLGYLALLLAAVVFLWFRSAARAEMKRRVHRAAPVLLCMLVYLFCTLISALTSRHADAVWLGGSRNEGVVTQALYVLSFAGVAVFAVPKQRLAAAFGLGLTLLGCVSVLHVFGIDPLRLFPRGLTYENTGEKFLGTIGNVGFLGALLCIAIPVLLSTLLRGRGALRFWLVLPLGLCVLLLIRIKVLAAFVGLTAGLLICTPFVLRFSKRQAGYWWGAVGLCGLFAVAALWLADPGQGFFHELHALLHGTYSDRFGTGRLYIWRQVIERVPARLWFGYGPDTMLLEKLTPFSRYDAALGRTVYAAIDAAHNEYLNILFHQGVIALAAYLAGIAFALCRFFRQAKQSPAAAVCGAAVICYAAEALFGISQPITAPYFWLALGLLCVASDTAHHVMK